MTLPFTYAVYIDWDYTPGGSIDFTTSGDNISQYVKEVNIDTGIDSPGFNDLTAKTAVCDLLLNNASRLFSPEYTSGTYYGKLVPGKPIKVDITQEGSTYTRYFGFTRDFEVKPGQYRSREASLHCEDWLDLFEKYNISIPLQENIRADTLLKLVISWALNAPIASATITFTTNTLNDVQVRLNGTVLTFKTTMTGVADEVQIGATKEDTASNLADAINRAEGAGTKYASSMTHITEMRASVSSNVVTLTATVRGALGNTYTLTQNGAGITLSSNVLAGGADYPTGKLSFDTGIGTFQIAGDRWIDDEKTNKKTSALSAIKEIIESERGYLWVAGDGTIVFKNREYVFQRIVASPTLTLSSEALELEGGLLADEMANYFELTFVPRSTLTTGVVASLKNPVKVEAGSGSNRYNPTAKLPAVRNTVIKLPFVDPDTGAQIGAHSIEIPLVAGTDWEAGSTPDGTDYTGTSYLTFSMAIKGSNIEVSVKNTAAVPIYITRLDVRGTGIVGYNSQRIVREDETSQNANGQREKRITIPLDSGQNYAESLCDYLLNKYKDPAYRVKRIGFGNTLKVGSVKLFSLEKGDVIAVTDHQSAISSIKYMITGASYRLTPGKGEIKFSVWRLDDEAYWLLGDATYGELNVTTRLGV